MADAFILQWQKQMPEHASAQGSTCAKKVIKKKAGPALQGSGNALLWGNQTPHGNCGLNPWLSQPERHGGQEDWRKDTMAWPDPMEGVHLSCSLSPPLLPSLWLSLPHASACALSWRKKREKMASPAASEMWSAIVSHSCGPTLCHSIWVVPGDS